ncbi:hypothetical protein PV11_02652 [Exophiala sideris]|uniref:Uncharacterized protein n=1 Tax=Exophiala sideris TaxID=1016849 RepID=A0A0D1YX14_9EURO|nr:hypothetical protein PV11_02652 [Exophiala sideris]
MNRGVFSQFLLNLDRYPVALGAIEPYEDTRQPIASLAEHLETNNLGAVWENATEGYVMVLYSCKAPAWSGHGQREVPGSESRLHIMVRNKLPGFHVEDWVSELEAATSSKDSTVEADTGTTSNGSTMQWEAAMRPRDPVNQRDTLQRLVTERNAMSKHLGAYVGSPSETLTMNKDRSNSTRSPITPITPGSPAQQDSPLPHGLSDQAAMGPSFQTQVTFSANFKQLVNPDREKKRPIFYIAFAQSHPAEAQAITKWLTEDQAVSARYIYTDAEKTAWSDMRDETNLSKTKSGIVLFLEGTQAYCDLRYLAKWVKKLACFSISLPQPGSFMSSSISRLFPRGMVLFITEYTMMEFPEEVLIAMRWFEEQSRGKEKTRKLGLVPNVKEWILSRALVCDKHIQETYLGMLRLIYRFETQTLNAWHGSLRDADPDRYVTGEKPGDEDGVLLSVPQLPGYANVGSLTMDTKNVATRDCTLIQYFCGWAALRVNKYRSFDLLDDHQTNEMTPHSWHVAFRKPMAFVESLKHTS